MAESPRPCTEFQYAVKLVQGVAPKLTNASVIAPGTYFTAINVHNPSTCKLVKFRWKVAVADLDGKHVSQISSFRDASLRPDEALEIDALDIARAAGIALTRFVKGFVVIESPCELDVVAVYTALPAGQAAPSSGAVAFHTERVPARKIEACLDLKLDISTGVVPWTLTSIPTAAGNLGTVPYQATIIPDPYRLTTIVTWSTQTGSLWISGRGVVNSGPPFAAGWYVFQYCFTLCSGFKGPALNMSARVDDYGWARLNGLYMGTTSTFPVLPNIPQNYNATTPQVLVISSGFLPGRNCLEMLVYNDFNNHPSNPVGLNLKCELTAERGACREGCGCCS